jgi:hypothetical protein
MHRIMNIDPKPSMNGVRLEDQGEWESSSIVTSLAKVSLPQVQNPSFYKSL